MRGIWWNWKLVVLVFPVPCEVAGSNPEWGVIVLLPAVVAVPRCGIAACPGDVCMMHMLVPTPITSSIGQ